MLTEDSPAPVVDALAQRIMRTPTAAEEVTQDAFLSAFRDAGGYDPARGSVRTWLLGIVHHRGDTFARWSDATIARGGRFSSDGGARGIQGRRPDGQTATGIARATGELAATPVRPEGDHGEASVLELLDQLIAMTRAQVDPEPVVTTAQPAALQ